MLPLSAQEERRHGRRTADSDSALLTRGSFAPCPMRSGRLIAFALNSGDALLRRSTSFGSSGLPMRTLNMVRIGFQYAEWIRGGSGGWRTDDVDAAREVVGLEYRSRSRSELVHREVCSQRVLSGSAVDGISDQQLKNDSAHRTRRPGGFCGARLPPTPSAAASRPARGAG